MTKTRNFKISTKYFEAYSELEKEEVYTQADICEIAFEVYKASENKKNAIRMNVRYVEGQMETKTGESGPFTGNMYLEHVVPKKTGESSDDDFFIEPGGEAPFRGRAVSAFELEPEDLNSVKALELEDISIPSNEENTSGFEQQQVAHYENPLSCEPVVEADETTPQEDQGDSRSQGLPLDLLVSIKATKKRRALLVSFFLFTLVGTLGVGYYFKDYLSILTRMGPTAFLQEHSALSESEDLDAKFSLAWGEFKAGYIDDAKNSTLEILSNKKVKPYTKGKCFYLLASVEKRVGNYEQSIELYKEARLIFKDSGRVNMLLSIMQETATSYLYLGDIKEALYWKASCYSIETDDPLREGYNLRMDAEFAFRTGDYEEALRLTEERLSFFEKSNAVTDISDSLSDIGFYLSLLGRCEESKKFTYRADFLIQAKDLKTKYYHNLLNHALNNKCNGVDYKYILDDLRSYAQEISDYKLNWFITFVDEYDFTRSRKAGEGLPADPTDDAPLEGTRPTPEGGENLPADPSDETDP